MSFHVLVFFPGLQDWLLFQEPEEKVPRRPVRLAYRPVPVAREPSAGPGARPQEALPAPVFRRHKRRLAPSPSPFPAAAEKPTVAPVPRTNRGLTPANPVSAYPISTKKAHSSDETDVSGESSEPAKVSSGSASEGDGELSPPVLLKGPQRIPVPPSLKLHGGRFVISLKCAIGVDGSSEVSVLDSTGSIDLDEALQGSFSHLPWYPGESRGVPVAVKVRLIIEAHWETGADEIEWRGLRPASSI